MQGRKGWELPLGKVFKIARISVLSVSLEGETQSFNPDRFRLVPRPKVSFKPRITNAKI